MSSTNAALAWAAEQTSTFYALLASKLKDAGEDAPAGSLFEGVRGMQLALAGADGDGEAATGGKKGKRGKKSKADKPKRPPSAYNVFIVQESAKLKAAGFKSDKDHNLMKEIGAKWAAMSEAEKQAYKEKCASEGRTGPQAVAAANAAHEAAAAAAAAAGGGGAGPSGGGGGSGSPQTPANGGGGGGQSSQEAAEAEARRRRKEEKRRKKEAKKRAAAEAAAGEGAHKKHKHSHH